MARTYSFVKRSTFNVSARELFAWHARPGAFQRLQPPWESVEVLAQTPGLQVGAGVTIRVRIGPVPQRLRAVHTGYEEGVFFRDEQVEGPFARWVHTHRFIDEGPRRSVLEDEVEYVLPLGGLGSVFGAGLARRRLESMFAYRHALTRMDLERHAAFADRPRLTVAVTGSTGLLGSALGPFLTTGGHAVKRLVRRPGTSPDEVAWNPAQGILDAASLDGVDAVVNLAGAPVASRWTPAHKAEIHDSRVKGTRLLCETLAKLPRKPKVLVNASAVGFYGDGGDAVLTEQSPPGEGFLADVCRAWEAATAPARDAGIRVVLLRIGMVLSPRGGALAALLPLFKAGAGGKLGSGRQWTPWIALEDVVGALYFALLTDTLEGPVNAVSPQPLTNAAFSKALGHALHRPAFLPAPSPALKLVLGGALAEEVLLGGQRLKPEALLRHGFPFLQPDLPEALRFMLGA